MSIKYAEDFALPLYKWIGERCLVVNMAGRLISNFPGGIGFSFFNASPYSKLKVVLKIFREDGTSEPYIVDTYPCGELEGGMQKRQTHQLPLFPYEGRHGRITHIAFSYLLHRDGKSIPSKFNYRFAGLDDFHLGRVRNDDFLDPYFRTLNEYRTSESIGKEVVRALNRINYHYDDLPVRAFFTKGNTWDPGHPVHEIHRQIDAVINRKIKDPGNRHYIRLAIFDFDNNHIAEHLQYAFQNGVDVECFGDWSAVSSMNCAGSIASMRRAGIPVYGIVRNTPCDPSGGITSMHTKIIIFDGEVVHSSSYNLHFHLWGGNREHALFYYSQDFALLYENIYNAIRGGVIQPVAVIPESRYNLYYSFGSCLAPDRTSYRPQDAVITEIQNARHSILVCMFNMDFLTGVPFGSGSETDLISALICARDRGVRVKIITNGLITHTGPLPEAWDKDFKRPPAEPFQRLRNAWMEVVYVYYHEGIYSPLHHKFAVFDEHTVIAGSYNWYTHSVNSDETLSVIRDEKLAADFLTEADNICKSYRLGWE